MKSLISYIGEGLRVNKSTKENVITDDYIFKSHITNSPHEFRGYNFLVSSHKFAKSDILILIDSAKEIIDYDLVEKDDMEFVKSWYNKAKDIYDNNKTEEYKWLCNGDKLYFGNAKFTLDLLKYAYNKIDLTSEIKNRINEMIKNEWRIVRIHANEMNWY